jgi:hypothetical protein
VRAANDAAAAVAQDEPIVPLPEGATMPPTYRRLTTRFTCADLTDPFGFGRRADVVSDADTSRPPRTRPAEQR